jgi:hypothetical protein
VRGQEIRPSRRARKVLLAAWHVVSREQPFKAAPRRTTASTTVSASCRCFLAA